MLYTPQTKKALKLCFEAHKNQLDKSGLPYVFHPFHLAEQMPDEDTTVAALLHDVVEDTAYTLRDLAEMGFSDAVISALKLLTHRKPAPYLQYVWAVRGNPVARAVKLADLRHNSDLSRLGSVTEKDRVRVRKYRMAMAILGEHPKETDGTYRVVFPLDEQNCCHLSVFYSEAGAERYSLDTKSENGVQHDAFSAKDAERILALLPDAESLPEALAVYLRSHDAESFAVLLGKSGISHQSFRD